MEGPDAGRLQKCSRVKTRQLVTSWRQQQAERFGTPRFSFFFTEFNQMSDFSDVKCVGMIFFFFMALSISLRGPASGAAFTLHG